MFGWIRMFLSAGVFRWLLWYVHISNAPSAKDIIDIITVKKQTIVGENTQDCRVCPQVMPDCNAAECAEGSRCMVVPQSCHQCARTECLPSLTGQAQCVACDKKMPLCSCQPGQDCVIHPMTCEKCSWAKCK